MEIDMSFDDWWKEDGKYGSVRRENAKAIWETALEDDNTLVVKSLPEELTEGDKIYHALIARKSKIVYGHCRTCIDEMPIGTAPKEWARLEAIIDLETGLLVVGCRRCNLHVVSAMVDSSLIGHLDNCGCERCERERQQTRH
jgi:hypothetical protein